MKKRKSKAFGHDTYMLGKGKDGYYYWMEEACFDCGWYWSGGYMRVYTNQLRPNLAVDIQRIAHFDTLFMKEPSNADQNAHDRFVNFFEFTPFTDKEIWIICELMASFYTARKYSDMLYTGGVNYIQNPVKSIKNQEEYDRINKVVIPEIMEKLYIILDHSPLYEVTETSDAFESGDDFAIYDNLKKDYYVYDKTIPTFKTKAEAEKYLKKILIV